MRAAREDDVPAIAELFAAAFPRWPRFDIRVPAEDHLRWKLASHNTAMRYQVIVEAAGGRVVGTNLGVVHPIAISGDQGLILHGTDIAVAEDHRGGGLLSAMRDLRQGLLGEVTFGMGYTAHAAVSRVVEREGWLRLANEMAPLTRVLRPAQAVRGAGLRRAARGAIPFAAASLPRRAVRAAGLAIQEVQAFDPRFDALYAAVLERFALIGDRSAERLTWRFGDPRAGSHTVLAAERGGELAGYAVASLSSGSGYLTDILVSPAHEEEVVDALARAVLDQLREAGCASVECWLPVRHPYRVALEACGFRALGAAIPYRFFPGGRASAADAELIADPEAAIHLTLCESDQI